MTPTTLFGGLVEPRERHWDASGRAEGLALTAILGALAVAFIGFFEDAVDTGAMTAALAITLCGAMVGRAALARHADARTRVDGPTHIWLFAFRRGAVPDQ